MEAAEVIARALPAGWEPLLCPVADGGDGTLDCLVSATRGHIHHASVTGPLFHTKINARWGELGNQQAAVIEMAEAAGLRLLEPKRRSAAHTTTHGVGELIRSALDEGFPTIYVGLGGSATNDGGAGCAQALGIRFLDSNGVELPPGGIHLSSLQSIDLSRQDSRIANCRFICLADVQNPLVGPSGTTALYGPQKGATPSELELLGAALQHYATVLQQELQVDVATLPGGGAAGGLGASLHVFCRATIVSGIDYLLDLMSFDDLLAKCDLVLTAEGTIDEQTTYGKGLEGVARRARRFKIPVHAFAGKINGNTKDLCRWLGLHSIHSITPPSLSDAEALTRAGEFLSLKVREFARRAN